MSAPSSQWRRLSDISSPNLPPITPSSDPAGDAVAAGSPAPSNSFRMPNSATPAGHGGETERRRPSSLPPVRLAVDTVATAASGDMTFSSTSEQEEELLNLKQLLSKQAARLDCKQQRSELHRRNGGESHGVGAAAAAASVRSDRQSNGLQQQNDYHGHRPDRGSGAPTFSHGATGSSGSSSRTASVATSYEANVPTVRHGARYASLRYDDTAMDGKRSTNDGEDRADAVAEELAMLEKEAYNRQQRIRSRETSLRRKWATSTISTGLIYPPPTPVQTATTDTEVQERALAAEDFARNQSRWKKARATPPADAAATSATEAAATTKQLLSRSSNSAAPIMPFISSVLPVEEAAPWPEGVLNQSGLHRLSDLNSSASPEPRELNDASLASIAVGRMSMCSCSIARITDGTLAVMEMLSNRPDVVMPSPAETGVVRKGDVLSSRHILKLDLQEALHERHGSTGMIAGAPYFRIVPKLNIAGVAQATISATRTILNELHRAHIDGPVIWVNLREEPLVYIGDASYIVRDRSDPLTPVIIPNVTGNSIEAVEQKLKQEVLQEAYENGGNVSVHLEGKASLMEDQWVCAGPKDVSTLAEVFRRVRKESPSAVMYFRRPITQDVGPQPEDFDFVLEACLEEPKAVFVFSCQTGRGRTSSMMQVANIVRFYQLCVKDVTADVRVLRGKVNAPSYRTIQKLVSLFPDGKLHERRLAILMELADKIYSMADHINEAFSEMEENPEEAKMRLQLYALFLVFSYYCEQRLWNYSTKSPFAQWLSENPEMKLLISSVREKLSDQLMAERVDAPLASGPEAEALRVIRHRRGNVLSAGRILCSLPMESKSTTEIPSLRQLASGVPILTCGRVGELARAELIRAIRKSFPRNRAIHWISLRAEPMVLINEVAYTLTDYNAPVAMAETGITMHVSVQAMEQIEDRLRRDVLLEAQECGGYIILHRVTRDDVREAVKLKVCSVRTPKSTMEDFVESSGVSYYRIPMPFSGQLLSSDVDPLLRYFVQSNISKNDVVVINDSVGTTRTTVALNILTLYLASQLKDLRSIQTTQDLTALLRSGPTDCVVHSAKLASMAGVDADVSPDQPVELLIASTICQMLTAGSLLRTVDAVITLGGRGRQWNILHQLDYQKRRIGVMGNNKPQCITDALHGLRCYLLVLLSCLYLDDVADLANSCPFSDWVYSHSEVANIIEDLQHRGEAALRYVAADNLMKADLSRRCGNVLTANFCLKADHFPGCQKKGLRPALCGAPNLRKVQLVNVYGVAIPTIMGIHNILSLLGASGEPMATYPGQTNDTELYLGFAAPRLFDPTFKSEELTHPLRGSVVWVNLREEPILYVGDRPFVFRDLAAPYVNVELTGIQTEKIELVEDELKRDVLTEAAQYDYRFLVHDEGSPGELVGAWEPATVDTVKTLREVYDELVMKGFRCLMLRLPVTDEQSPEIRDFDLLVNALLPRIAKHLDRRETLSFVFNCQMGRGRTTTGMVICCLLIGLVIPEYYDELQVEYKDSLYSTEESELSHGEYDVIVQLKRVLAQGRAAKLKVDLVLEACSKMQNLRTAIESFAITASSPDVTEAGRARAHHAGIHYLRRYFNLILFAVYLHEQYNPMVKRMRRSFTEWMALHPELVTLSDTCALK